MNRVEIAESSPGLGQLTIRDLETSSVVGASLSMEGLSVQDSHSRMDERDPRRVERRNDLLVELQKRGCPEQIEFKACRDFIEGRSDTARVELIADRVQISTYFAVHTAYIAISAECFNQRAQSALNLHTSAAAEDPMALLIAQLTDDEIVKLAQDQGLRNLIRDRVPHDQPAIARMPPSVRVRFNHLEETMGSVTSSDAVAV